MANNPHGLRMRLARKLARIVFPYVERYLDLHVTPADFYSPVPRLDELPRDIYERRHSLTGVDMNEPAQLRLLHEVLPRYLAEYTAAGNPGLSIADAFVLHAMIRERRPGQMVEIGGGHSTLIALQALQRNRDEGHDAELICIEPYPSDMLRQAAGRGMRLIECPVQAVDLALFETTDLLFIDSSHVCRIGSDATHEMLEIVPRLPVGAAVHWHDIVLPANYWREWTERNLYFWNESYFLHAFLLFNRAFSVNWGARYMALTHGQALEATLPFYRDGQHITSFWAERVRP